MVEVYRSLEELYGLVKEDVELTRFLTESGRWLEVFKNPYMPKSNVDAGIVCSEGPYSSYLVLLVFPEFTCLCPRTSQPDFANITIEYEPNGHCVELKSLKYYLNSFRSEGHFHEEVINLIYSDLFEALRPLSLKVVGKFNVRGGIQPTIAVGS